MLVAVQSDDQLHTVALPQAVAGAHWITDAEGLKLALVEGKDAGWSIDPCTQFSVRGLDGGVRPTIDLSPDDYLVMNLDGADGRSWCLIFYPHNATALESRVYGFSGDAQITVGRALDNAISYDNQFVSGHHLKLDYSAGHWKATDLGSSNGVFVNDQRLRSGSPVSLRYGDIVVVLGLRIALGAGLIACNNPGGEVSIAKGGFVEYEAIQPPVRENVAEPEVEYFYPALRFARAIEKKDFVVDAPPQPEKEDETSLAMRIGPSLVMAMASVLSASMFVGMMGEQGGSMMRAVPMVAMAVAMLAGSVLWPILNSRNQKKQRERKEAQRRASYSQYLSSVLSAIAREEALQREILNENRISVQECLRRAQERDVRLMDRTSLHADYLDLRLGVGEVPLEAGIRFPDQHFSVIEDDLREAVDAQARTPRVLSDVPLAFPLVEKHVVGMIGDQSIAYSFVRGLVCQIAALCSYEDVKIVLICDEAERDKWSFSAHLPHCFSDDRAMRFFACGLEETAELGMFLERVLDSRRGADRFEAREAKPYYVVVCTSSRLAEKAEIVRSIVSERQNLGVSFMALAQKMPDLPKECRSVISLGASESYVLDRDDPTGSKQLFSPDIMLASDTARTFAFAMGKICLDISVESQRIPSRLGFLEMLGAGNVDHLNIASRWHDSNASATLACCVGVDAQGEQFLLNLHEKFHGPHGLIAGTTGSGKSEFIITYILSMALTYSPDDVAFVLIDYKGGGLAKAFDNDHVRLPHLAGVITNLDGAAITRSLVSIKSELKRRQALFNRARDVVGGDNIDIYSYLDLFRQGKMTEPCPHLFIVADEFAELKQQEPEFMDELISAARIGRSLGVHLILATQKPSGVVNDQIWSNARFKVCLKVADEADSREMIKRPDAAELAEAGRFYLLVGYNEYFALGQSGYSGTRYVARDRFAETKDDSVVLIADTGRPLVSVKPSHDVSSEQDAPESIAVLAHIQRTASTLGLRANQLWLAPIPAMITVDGLREKYLDAFPPESPFTLNPIIGEFDDPECQRQSLLTLPLTQQGNALIYGTPDSGAEALLHALLYSCMRDHSSLDLHAYAIDFGTQSLGAFAGAPQMGDVIYAGDDDKITRFFDFMEKVASSRRAVLAEYGGSYVRYVQEHDDMPCILVVLNDIAAFVESYPKLEDNLMRFMREAGRNGIHLVATAAGTSSVRMRMRQSFRQVLACDLADASDYSMIFGSMRGVPQPRGFARGLVKVDDGLFEFQGAHLTMDGDDFAFAAQVSLDAAAGARLCDTAFAVSIPVAPELVTPQMVLSAPEVSECIPYGIYDDDLSIARFDFSETVMARCVFQRRKSGVAFGKALLNIATSLTLWKVSLLDVAQLFGDEKPEGCVFATRKDDFAESHLTMLLEKAERGNTEKHIVIITGVGAFLSRLPFDRNTAIKAGLRSLRAHSGVRMLLVDSISDATFNFEDWFKAHISNKDGMWIGPGVDAQNVISTTFSRALNVGVGKEKLLGFDIEEGNARLVHLACVPDEEGDAKGDLS